MDSLINYGPEMSAPQEARLLAPVIGEHEPIEIQKPLVNLVGSLRDWAGEAKDKELEKAKLDIAANSGKRTEDQESNWMLSNADLTNLEISAASQTWGTQHLIDVKQYEHLDPNQYQQHLASEAKILTENSANPEWMATRLNNERASLEEAHGRAHTEYKAIQGVTAMDNLQGVQIAKSQELATKHPELREKIIDDNHRSFAEMLNDSQRGHFAWLALNKRTNQQLEDGDATYYNLQQSLLEKGLIHTSALDDNPGLKEALTKYSVKASSDVVNAYQLWIHQIQEGQDTTQIQNYFNQKLASVVGSRAPISPEAKAIIQAYAQDLEAAPGKFGAIKETARQAELATVHNTIESTKTDLAQAIEEGNEPEIQRLSNLLTHTLPVRAEGISPNLDIKTLAKGNAGIAERARKYLPNFQAASQTTGVPVPLLMAVAKSESSFGMPIGGQDADGTRSNATGMMQVIPHWHREAGKSGHTTPLDEHRLRTDVTYNITRGAEYLSYLLKRHNGSVELALREYKEGPKNMNSAKAGNYAKQVMSNIPKDYSAERSDLHLHLQGAVQGALNKGNAARIKKEVQPLLDEMQSMTTADELNEKTLEIRKRIHNGGLATSAAAKALDSEYRVKVSTLYSQKLKELGNSLEGVDATEGPAAANAILLDMQKLIQGNDVLPKAAGATWTKSALKLINERLKHHEPELTTELLNVIQQFKGADAATVTAAVGKAFAEDFSPAALTRHRQALEDNKEGLRLLTGIYPKSEAEAYQAIIPKENLSKFDTTQQLRDQALKLGAPRNKVDSIHRLIHRGEPGNPGGTSTPGYAISRTKELMEGFTPGNYVDFQDETLEPSVLKATGMAKEMKAYQDKWNSVPEQVVTELKTQRASVGFVYNKLQEYLKQTSRHGASSREDEAIISLLTKDVPGEEPGAPSGTLSTTGIRMLGVPAAEANTLRAEALIKAVGQGKLEDRGAANQAVLDLQYVTPYKTKPGSASDGEFLAESGIYKATAIDDRVDLVELFKVAGKYAKTTAEQVGLATQAMNNTQYRTSGKLRISKADDLIEDLKAAGGDASKIATFDQILGNPYVQKAMEGIGVNQASGAKEEVLGSALHWYYNKQTKSLTGLDPHGVAAPLVLPWEILRLARHTPMEYAKDKHLPGFNPFAGFFSETKGDLFKGKYFNAPTPHGRSYDKE